jgi:hypothetical protein
MSVLTDPSIPPVNVRNLGLTAQEQKYLDDGTQPPTDILSDFQEQDIRERSVEENYQLQKMEQQNAALQAQLGQTTNQLNQVQNNFSHLSGQLDAMQQAQAQAQRQAQVDTQFAFTDDEIEQHGDVLPIINKAVAKTQSDMERMFQERLEQEKVKWQQEATGPLQQQLQQTQAILESQQQQQRASFDTELLNRMSQMGLGSMAKLVDMPAFKQRYNQPLYPGSTIAWGDQLTAHVKGKTPADFQSAIGMLQDFRDQHTDLGQQSQSDTSVVPTGSMPQAQDLSSEAQSKLAEARAWTEKYRENMSNANQGYFPKKANGQTMTRPEYRKYQAEIQTKINLLQAQAGA